MRDSDSDAWAVPLLRGLGQCEREIPEGFVVRRVIHAHREARCTIDVMNESPVGVALLYT